ncbi:MAG: hypothetical protein LBL66_00195 [Clostridiales bacterium]|jgi:hypothetical protein|nr:hypothetical protein [Clostridiales bacterium]
MKQWKKIFAAIAVFLIAATAAACAKSGGNGEGWYKNEPDRSDTLTLDQLAELSETEVTDLKGKLIKVSMTVTGVSYSSLDAQTGANYPYPILSQIKAVAASSPHTVYAHFIDMNYWEMDKKADDTVIVLGYVHSANRRNNSGVPYISVTLAPAKLV